MDLLAVLDRAVVVHGKGVGAVDGNLVLPGGLVGGHDKHIRFWGQEHLRIADRDVHDDPDVNVHELGQDDEEDGLAGL